MKLSRVAFGIVLTLATVQSLYGAQLVNVDRQGLALQGYDPVAFFTDGKPAKGNPTISYSYRGAIYHFVSREHQEMFEADPEKYEPRFGGYCAYGVAVGGLYPIDVEAFFIFEGQLLLQKNKKVRSRFNKDPRGYYQKAIKNWPKLQEKRP